MEWYQNKKAHEGNCRNKEKFLWFPKCINGRCRWLERAKFKQRYVATITGLAWVDLIWEDE